MLFTTSWDDGYASDMTIANLLDRYGLTGTFYACPQTQHRQAMLSDAELRELSTRHELGAHSMTHPKLSKIPLAQAKEEIEASKRWIEERTGRPCDMFCSPYGDYNTDVKRLMQEAGFRGARTVEALRFAADDLFALPTSLQVYPFPWRARYTRWWHSLDPLARLRASCRPLLALHVPFRDCWSWQTLAQRLFLIALETDQPFFHLWGHSAEVQRLGMMAPLETFLAFVATHRQRIEPVTNGELVLHLDKKA